MRSRARSGSRPHWAVTPTPTERASTARPRRAVVKAPEPPVVPDPVVPDAPVPPVGEVPLPLAGIRVLDLTAFWAGPLIGHACAILGAEVIHVESTKQPDGIRCNTTRPMSEPQWWEWCPMFQGSNTNKLDLAVELDTERGRELFLDLVAVSDVVIDNFSPRVLDQLDLAQDVLLARNPEVVVLRAPGYGVDGPWRERLAYAPTIEAQAGIAWTTGFPDRGPEPPSGIADALGGAHADLRPAAGARAPPPDGSGHVPRVPDGRCVAQPGRAAGDRALGLRRAARTSRQPLGHLRAPGRLPHRRRRRCHTRSARDARPVGGDLDRGRRPVGRVGNAARPRPRRPRGDEDALDARIAAWCDTRSTDEIVRSLSGAGIPCEPVVRAHEHDRLPPVVARELFERVDHPVTGTAEFIGAPFRFARGPRRHHRSRSPLLGEHNRDVLTRILGLSDTDVDELEAAGVIGDVVVGGVLH